MNKERLKEAEIKYLELFVDATDLVLEAYEMKGYQVWVTDSLNPGERIKVVGQRIYVSARLYTNLLPYVHELTQLCVNITGLKRFKLGMFHYSVAEYYAGQYHKVITPMTNGDYKGLEYEQLKYCFIRKNFLVYAQIPEQK